MSQQAHVVSGKKRRRGSAFGGINYNPNAGQADVLVSPAAMDAGARIKPLGKVANQRFSRTALAQKLATALKTQQRKLKVLFALHDVDNNGSLELEEFLEVLERFCPGEVSGKEARDLMSVLVSRALTVDCSQYGAGSRLQV
jgi:hypothetical protein